MDAQLNSHRSPRGLRCASRAASGWALGYGLYRGYYAAGGTIGMLGTPVSHQQWLLINAVATVLLLIAAVLPIATVRAWENRAARPVLLALCWLVTVSCVSHALFGMLERVMSLTGTITISYPFWQDIDRRQADVQDLLFNEPWFLVEALLWARIAWTAALRQSRWRGWWLGTAGVASLAIVTVGLLSAFKVIPGFIVG
jgi:hypothetical protein